MPTLYVDRRPSRSCLSCDRRGSTKVPDNVPAGRDPSGKAPARRPRVTRSAPPGGPGDLSAGQKSVSQPARRRGSSETQGRFLLPSTAAGPPRCWSRGRSTARVERGCGNVQRSCGRESGQRPARTVAGEDKRAGGVELPTSSVRRCPPRIRCAVAEAELRHRQVGLRLELPSVGDRIPPELPRGTGKGRRYVHRRPRLREGRQKASRCPGAPGLRTVVAVALDLISLLLSGLSR